jgi:hypothetical protein
MDDTGDEVCQQHSSQHGDRHPPHQEFGKGTETNQMRHHQADGRHQAANLKGAYQEPHFIVLGP